MPQHSEEIHEIISRPPSWILRWGVIYLSLLMVMLFAMACFIQYPTVLTAPMVLSSRNPPVQLFAKSSGQLHILAKEQTTVEKQQPLAWIENNSDYSEVLEMEKLLEKYASFSLATSSLAGEKWPAFSKSGELQAGYLQWRNAMEEFRIFSELQLNPMKIKALQAEIQYYEEYKEKLDQEKHLLAQSLNLSSKKYQADSLLWSQGVMAPLEVQTSEQALIQQKRSLAQLQNNVVSQNLQISNKEAGMSQLQQEEKQTLFKLQQEISKTRLALQNNIQLWKQKYLLTSPFAGRVNWARFFADNEYVFADKPLASILPEDSSSIIGYVSLPVSGAGKVQTGQKVWVGLSNYPLAEFGAVEGEIIHIALLPQEDSKAQSYYNISIRFPNGLHTSLHKEIPFQSQMQGQANIITEDLSLMARLFYGLRGLWAGK